MASFLLKISLLCFLAVFANSWMANAGDPDITSDFLVPPNVTKVDGNLFTFTGFRGLCDAKIPGFRVIGASKAEFPVLDGQSVSMTVFQIPAGSVIPPHTHPRSAELFFVIKGSLEVGFVDTTNKLFTQTLQSGDLFVFPKALMHFQYNAKGNNQSATAIAAFGSANPGTVLLPPTLFGTGVDDIILAKAFMTDVATIQKIKAGFGSKA